MLAELAAHSCPPSSSWKSEASRRFAARRKAKAASDCRCSSARAVPSPTCTRRERAVRDKHAGLCKCVPRAQPAVPTRSVRPAAMRAWGCQCCWRQLPDPHPRTPRNPPKGDHHHRTSNTGGYAPASPSSPFCRPLPGVSGTSQAASAADTFPRSKRHRLAGCTACRGTETVGPKGARLLVHWQLRGGQEARGAGGHNTTEPS